MTLYKNVNGERVAMTADEEQAIRDEWSAPPPPPTENDVKAESMRRILSTAPEWKQRNLIAQAAILAKKGEANWTSAEQTAWNAGEAIWTQIAAIRTASDVLEAIDQIPSDYTDDKHWP